ncbi:ribosome biogenesis GTPase YlqF [Microcoleus sp. FACHB-68]|uniref:ribosome biogenesis GTPase YlqF n=1 Tax=Microcoleus sp. FACHB-68 TaxID=2692826 RepID=UPI001681E58D|nr:ribosome biogenesis GTPase YlqF [Microcoleus sp. FACHB-68]MBD1937300.1 ribosome biogenesis GTPase YlqF [Microcoleus sp. FACHB-68]
MSSIQWYPGHIAKAERALKEQLKRVDVVLEVRDARIPLATHHPQTAQWVGAKGRVLVINRLDMITPAARQRWEEWFRMQGEKPYYTDAQHGKGVKAISQAAQDAGAQMNERRRERGMLPRPVRAVVIGFPNVGKSALINRLLNRRVVESAARAGVTRQLRWVRISEEIELLDAPGVIPARIEDEDNAFKLAICDDIGEASYDNYLVAAKLVDLLTYLEATSEGIVSLNLLQSRYELDPISIEGDEYLQALAKLRYKGDVERTARQLLTDFRKGLLGQIPLELPPPV